MAAPAEFLYDVLQESKRLAFDEPKWFFETILHQELEPWQLEGVEVIADVHRKRIGIPTKFNHKGLARLTLKSCHGPGKTHFLADVMHWWNYCFYGKVVCTAPKEKQLKTRLWPRYRKILRGAEESYKALITVNVTDIKVVNDEDWGCVAETASDPENMAGYHDEPQLFLVDEGSARVLDPMYPVIEGALTTPGSVLVVIGNPTRTTGEFWASHNKRGTMELYYRMHVRPEDSRFVDPQWVKNMIRKYGKDSPITKVRAFGEFADTEENQLIALGWMEDARLRDFKPDGSIVRMRMTIDVADGGEDETIIKIAEVYETATYFLTMKRYSFPQTTATDDIVAAAENLFSLFGMDKKRDDIVVDSMGVGTGVASNLITRQFNVVRYKGGSTEGINTKEYRNIRVQSYLVYRDELVAGRIYFHDDFCTEEDWEEFTGQMASIRTKPGIEKNEDLESKGDLKRISQKSPDMPDAGAMMFATQAPTLGDGTEGTMVFVSSVLNNYDGGLT